MGRVAVSASAGGCERRVMCRPLILLPARVYRQDKRPVDFWQKRPAAWSYAVL